MHQENNKIIKIKNSIGNIHATITPPASKSESNRVLIINALSGNKGKLENLSNARDTQTMIRLLQSDDKTLDVIDAGTTMRFLTAYLAITGQERILTGTKRMCERPIRLLVDALKSLGASIGYLQQEGYPPLQILEFNKREARTSHIKIKGDVSSQYITALLMVAPELPEGLKLELEGKIGSRPYIEMTLKLMELFGVTSVWKDNIITIKNQTYKPAEYKVESDWSASSYWYSVAALAKEANITIKGYYKTSLQGDAVIVKIMDQLGVASTFTEEGVVLTKKSNHESFTWDFTHCPDLAQTIAVICAAKNIPCRMSGLESLRMKETDRIAAIDNELRKFGSGLIEIEKDTTYEVMTGKFNVNNQFVNTYKDHRMAMAFAPLGLIGEINIENPDVVEKSYPHFWDDMQTAGFEIH